MGFCAFLRAWYGGYPWTVLALEQVSSTVTLSVFKSRLTWKSVLMLMRWRQHQFNFIYRLSWSISSNFGKNSCLKCVSQLWIVEKNSLQTYYSSTSKSFKAINVGTPVKVISSACYDKQQVCHSHARLVDSSGNRALWMGYRNLIPPYRGLAEPRESKLTLLKCTFNGKNYMCRLSWSTSSDFSAVDSWNVCGSLTLQKFTI